MVKNNRVKNLRLEAGLSQNQLARKANLDRGTVSAAESGKDLQELSISKLERALSEELGRKVAI